MMMFSAVSTRILTRSTAVVARSRGRDRCLQLQKQRFKSTTTTSTTQSASTTTTTTTAKTTAAAKESVAASASSKSSSKSSSESTTGGVPIISSLLAALAACSTVSGFTALVEYSTADSCLPYTKNGQRYDQGDFMGRFSRMLLACDPRLLLYTESQVRQAQALVEDGETKFANDRSMDRTLWEARRIVDAALHPDTKEVIPHPFRMSGYVPFNGPICVAMVASTSTLPLLFWAWVNQSQNALVNYYNRNAGSPMTNETLIKSYSIAVGSAVAVAFGLATFIQKKYPPEKAMKLMKFVAFPSSVAASSLNCYIVRSPEITTGIPLLDSEGNNVLHGSTSQVAAQRGVNSTTLSRAILQAPVYFIPPLLLGLGPIRNFISTNVAGRRVPVTTFLLLCSFGLGLPATVGMFPQISEIDPNDVEDKFQHLRNPTTGKPYEVYYYNKGL